MGILDLTLFSTIVVGVGAYMVWAGFGPSKFDQSFGHKVAPWNLLTAEGPSA